MPDEWFEVDDALSVSPRASRVGRGTALTEEATPILPCERLHRSRHIVKVCGWATHGIWCNCPFVTKPTPRYAMVTNLNVPHVLPIKPRKSDKIKQEEPDKIYGVPAVKVSKFGFPVDGIAYSARQIEAHCALKTEMGLIGGSAENDIQCKHSAPARNSEKRQLPRPKIPKSHWNFWRGQSIFGIFGRGRYILWMAFSALPPKTPHF